VDIWAIGCILGELTDGQPLFPGENEIDQLFCIQKILGPLTPDQGESFQKNPRFIGMKFPEMIKPETLEKRYLGKLSKKALSFMKQCLRMDPGQRITSSQALQHSYFDGIRDVEESAAPNQNCRIESANASIISNNQTVLSINPKNKGNLNATMNSPSNFNSQKSIQQANISNAKLENIAMEQQLKGFPIQRKNVHESNIINPRPAPVDKNSDRSSSLNKNAVKLEKLQQTYDPRRKKDSINHSQQAHSVVPNKKGKNLEQSEHIEGNFLIPDVFLKTKYGSSTQYNYDIQEITGDDSRNIVSKKIEPTSTQKEFRDTQPNFSKKKEENARNGEKSPIMYVNLAIGGDETPKKVVQIGLKKSQMTPTQLQQRKNKFNNTTYGSFGDMTESHGRNPKLDKTKSSFKTPKNHTVHVDQNPENELCKTESGQILQEGVEPSYQSATSQFPYLHGKNLSDKANSNPLEVLYGQSKVPVGWKGGKVSVLQTQHGPMEIIEAEPGQYNIVVNANTYNYTFNGSPNSWNIKNKKKN